VNAFIVDLENKPGEFARVAEAIAEKGINITGFSGATCGDSGSVALLTNDEAGTKRALTDSQCRYKEIELVAASLADKPGSLAQATRRLADAGVNILTAIPTGMSQGNVQVAFATDDPAKAREALGELVGVGSYSS
jgi:hypothetical protein